MPKYIPASGQESYDAARKLFREYAADINIDLGFQHFEEELTDLENMYAAPLGGLIICKHDDRDAGCVAIRRINENVCELKRMYVRPAFRNKGIGKSLLDHALALARELNYKSIRLDTLSSMSVAIKLYEDAGFVKIDPYYFNPNTNAVFFEMRIE